MNSLTWTLRVTASERGPTRVSARRHQFSVGRPIDFDVESATVSALEYALGAVGAEIVGGLRVFAKRRRLVLDEVEAVVHGEVEDPLVYLDVVGETGRPRLGRIHVKLYVSSREDDQIVRRLFEDVLERLPLVATLRSALRLDVDMTCDH